MLHQDGINSLGQKNLKYPNPSVKDDLCDIDLSPSVPPQNSINFTFANGQSASYDIILLMDISPLLYTKLQLMNSNENTINIDLPDYISFQNLNDFICLVKNNCMMIDESNSRTQELINVLKTSEYFQNEIYSSKIINDLVLQVLSVDNVFEYFDFCYWKIKALMDKKGTVETFWMNFLFKCFDMIENNFFDSEYIQKKVMKYNEKIIEEIITRLIHKIMMKEIEVNDDKISLIIKLVMMVRKQNSFFVAVVNENLLKQSDLFSDKRENSNSLNQVKPTVKVEIGKYELYYYYKEIKVELVDKEIFDLIFVLYYDNKKDEFDISVKIDNKNKTIVFPIISFSCELNFISNNSPFIHKKKSQIFLQNCENCKNPLNHLEIIQNLSKKIQLSKPRDQNSKAFSFLSSLPHRARLTHNGFLHSTNENDISSAMKTESISLSISLKLNYIQTVLMSEIVRKFPNIYDDKYIFRIDISMLNSIITNKALKNTNEDEIIIALINWIDNEINCLININDILQIIKWENVSYELLIEFIIKYPSINEEIKNSILNIAEKNNDNEAKKRYFVNSLISKFILYNQI